VITTVLDHALSPGGKGERKNGYLPFSWEKKTDVALAERTSFGGGRGMGGGAAFFPPRGEGKKRLPPQVLVLLPGGRERTKRNETSEVFGAAEKKGRASAR